MQTVVPCWVPVIAGVILSPAQAHSLYIYEKNVYCYLNPGVFFMISLVFLYQEGPFKMGCYICLMLEAYRIRGKSV